MYCFTTIYSTDWQGWLVGCNHLWINYAIKS